MPVFCGHNKASVVEDEGIRLECRTCSQIVTLPVTCPECGLGLVPGAPSRPPSRWVKLLRAARRLWRESTPEPWEPPEPEPPPTRPETSAVYRGHSIPADLHERIRRKG